MLDRPSFYAYRMSFRGEDGGRRRTEGVIGALGIETLAKGDVLPHEHTTPKAKGDRLNLLRAAREHVADLGLEHGARSERRARARCGADGRGHRRRRRASRAVADRGRPCRRHRRPRRVGAGRDRRWPPSLRDRAHLSREERRRGRPPGPPRPGHDARRGLSPDQLEVRAIHRLISGLPGVRCRGRADKELRSDRDRRGGRRPAHGHAGQGRPRLVTTAGRWLLQPLPPTRRGRARLGLEPARRRPRLSPQHEPRFQHGVDEASAAVAWRGRRRHCPTARDRGSDHRDGAHATAHAAQDHVLLAEARRAWCSGGSSDAAGESVYPAFFAFLAARFSFSDLPFFF